MARPAKCRMICRFPQTLEFTPVKDIDGAAPIILTLDEFEVIRLIDKEGLSQEQCSQRIQVARTTVQKIYDTARRKLADALVDGLPLRIQGGKYRLCSGRNPFCEPEDCYRQGLRQIYQKTKGNTTMRIAVTYENGQIFQHFGRTQQFKIYDTEDGNILSSEIISTNGHGHGALVEILSALQADVLICGGIGGGAQAALAGTGIKLYGGVQGEADAAVEALLKGTLNFTPDVQCDHHEGTHHGENCELHGEHHHNTGHDCGHNCGHSAE